MKLTLDISDAVAALLSKQDQPLEQKLRIDLAIHYYEHGQLSPGRAAELADMSRPAFESLLMNRKIVRPYTSEDLDNELQSFVAEA